MKSNLAVILVLFNLLWFSACQKSKTKTTKQFTLSHKTGVSIQVTKITGALKVEQVKASLSRALQEFAEVYKKNLTKKLKPKGYFELGFRVEPSGLNRMVLEGKGKFSGKGGETVKSSFVMATMGGKWKFSSSPGPSLIQTVFVMNPK